MASARSCSPAPLGAAWQLWLVRQLTRFGIRARPRLVVAAAATLCAAGALLAVASVRAWGDQAVTNLRAVPGFFDSGVDGLTNAMHLVLLVAVPLLLASAAGALRAVGLQRPDPAQAAVDRRVWQSLGLGARDVVLTHEVAPRLPVAVLLSAPLAAVGSLPSLTAAERGVVVLLLVVALAVELFRLAATARDVARPLTAELRGVWLPLARLAGAVALGALVGALAPVAGALLSRRHESAAGVATLTRMLARHDMAALAVAVAALLAGAALVALRCARATALAPAAAEPRLQRRPPGAIGGWLFPVTSTGRVLRAWDAAEVRAVVAAIAALVVARPTLSGPAAQAVMLVALSTVMAFCLTRTVVWGLTASVGRWRDHVERGLAPEGLAVRQAGAAGLAVAPLAAAVVAALVLTGTAWPAAVTLVACPLAATLVADAAVAQPGGELTEQRHMVIGLLQSALSVAGWALVLLHPALGWVLVFVLLGVFQWLSSRRLTLWLPRTRW